MSAEVLRKAAALMRERAEAADGTGVWREGEDLSFLSPIQQPFTAFVASWHPAVALAVADLLDETAADIDALMTYGGHAPTLAVARAYLGEAS